MKISTCFVTAFETVMIIIRLPLGSLDLCGILQATSINALGSFTASLGTWNERLPFEINPCG